MKHGVPYDVAFSLPPDERIAHLIVFAEQGDGFTAGGTWDWKEMRLVKDG